MLKDGCREELVAEEAPASNHLTWTNLTWTVRLGEEADVTGFFFYTSASAEELDPVAFEVEVSGDGQTWKLAAASQRNTKIGGVSFAGSPTSLVGYVGLSC